MIFLLLVYIRTDPITLPCSLARAGKKLKSTKRREKEGGKKNRKEKERKKSWDQVFKNKRKYCIGTKPSAILYIGILVTSTTTGHDGSVVSALASQAKGRGSIPSCGTSFFSHKYFPSSLSE